MTIGTEPELHRWMGRMEAKQDAILEKLESHFVRLNSHSDRIGKLERGRAWLLGLGAGIGLLLSQLKHLKDLI